MAQYKKLQNYCANYNTANGAANEVVNGAANEVVNGAANGAANGAVNGAANGAANGAVNEGYIHQKQQIKSINNQDDLDELKVISDAIVLIKYFATWCGPCKNFAPKYDKLVNESGPDVIAAEVDIDQLSSDIVGVPTTEVYVGGVKFATITGGSIEKLNNSIENGRALLISRNNNSTRG